MHNRVSYLRCHTCYQFLLMFSLMFVISRTPSQLPYKPPVTALSIELRLGPLLETLFSPIKLLKSTLPHGAWYPTKPDFNTRVLSTNVSSSLTLLSKPRPNRRCPPQRPPVSKPHGGPNVYMGDHCNPLVWSLKLNQIKSKIL